MHRPIIFVRPARPQIDVETIVNCPPETIDRDLLPAAMSLQIYAALQLGGLLYYNSVAI